MTPAWLALFVFQLARETGWHRDFILWEVSLAELLLYQQAAIFIEGRQWLVAPSPPATAQWQTLFSNWKGEP